jgi:hypothetical protein
MFPLLCLANFSSDYVFMSRHQNAGQSHGVRIPGQSLENAEKVRVLFIKET